MPEGEKTPEKRHEFTDDEYELLKSAIERERVFRALGKLGKWVYGFLTAAAVIFASIYAANEWIFKYIKKAATTTTGGG